ncbi:MAG: NADH-quinone oxidoreductase subunit NuoN [Gammaproteobacteria bacterium]|nr:NADH-quinone oxidoreductase subunit NuoN [Gammaproteobacteria bacterium]
MMNELNLVSFLPLTPVLIASFTSVVVMLLISMKRHHNLSATVTVLGLNAALGWIVWYFLNGSPSSVMGLFMVDGFSLFYMALILIAGLACCTLSHAYIHDYRDNKEELYILLLISIAGGMLLVAAQNMTSFFIGLELLSVPTYGLLAYTHERNKSLESGIKYMVLSATASASILMGMAFLYAFSGTLDFHRLGQVLVTTLHEPLAVTGVGLILVGLAFKLSLAPFHRWTPDVYQGAPAPVATFLATVSKVAVLGLTLRFLFSSGALAMDGVREILMVIAVLSVIIGNLLAVRQSNLKRLLGYSSIAHLGYILIALVAAGMSSLPTINIYIVAYVFTTIGAFGAVALMSSPYDGDEAESLADYRGLFWRRPVLTAVLTVMMLSLAGIPLTAGFIGKFFVVLSATTGAAWYLLGVVITGSAIGLYYYLRVLVVLYMTPPEKKGLDAQSNWGMQAGGVMVLLTSLLVLVLGVYPAPLLALAAMARFVVQ